MFETTRLKREQCENKSELTLFVELTLSLAGGLEPTER